MIRVAVGMGAAQLSKTDLDARILPSKEGGYAPNAGGPQARFELPLGTPNSCRLCELTK